MQFKVKNFDNKEVGAVELNDSIFGLEERQDILSRVVNWQLAKRRSGCHKTKQRSEVQGSTRKIYRQKGTGQARHGSIRAPIFRGGGIVFGPLVRSHEYKLNKNVRDLGLKTALSLKLKNNSIIILDHADIKSHKTADLSKQVGNFGEKSMLFIDVTPNDNLKRATANLYKIDVLPVIGINVLDILQHEKLILTVEALKKIEERFA
jgi:large subunit ribosomal protein L4